MTDESPLTANSDLLQSWSQALNMRLDLNSAVGGSDPVAVGGAQLELLKAAGIPLEGRAVLCDLGCGVGRASAFVADSCGPEVSLIGIDIVPEFVAFCQNHIGRASESLDFRLMDTANEHYPGSSAPDVFGLERESMQELALNFSGRVDFLWAFSVFTHLGPSAATELLRFVRRLLSPGGRALLTFFVFDADSEDCMADGTNAFDLNGGSWDGVTFYGNPEDKLAFVGFRDDFLLKEFRSAGLTPLEKTLGNWRDQRRGSFSFQDSYLLTAG